MDILAGNHLARALYTDFEALPTRSRNNQRTHGTKRLRPPSSATSFSATSFSAMRHSSPSTTLNRP